MIRPVFAIHLLLSLACPPAIFLPFQVRVGRDLELGAGQQAKTVVCALCSARSDGALNGHLIVFAGDAYVNGAVRGDVLDFGGVVSLTDNARIGGKVLVFGGRLHREAAAAIGRGQIVLSPAVFLPILLALALFIAGLILLLRLFYRPRDGVWPPLPRF